MGRGLAVALLLGAANAFAVAPSLTGTTPAGGQRGTTLEVTLRGERLGDTQEIFFYDPGIAVEKFVEVADKQVKARLTIAPDCPLGEHALRLRTAGGISALRVFFVGPFPSVEEKEPNNSAAAAQAVALNSTVQGTIAAEDVDWFSVVAQPGQRLSVEVEGARLGRTMFDPIIIVQDAAGRVLATSDDTPLLGHDGYVSLVAPAAGTYTIQLRDAVYSGAGHVYRLHLGDFPRPASVMPLGGRAGETIEAHFLGDPAGEFVRSVTLPSTPIERFGAAPEHEGVPPSPNWLRVAPFPNAPAVKAGTTLTGAARIDATVPFAINGVLATRGEPAFYRFTAKKDQNLELQVIARRLGSPLDSVVSLYGPKGNSLGANDDAAGNPDSSLRVRLPADGEYTLKIADQLGRGGPLYTYRVEVSEARPRLTLSIPDTARYDNETRKSIVVPRGNRFAVLMNINRDAFNGDVQLAFDGLPPGITAHADVVPGSLSAVPVIFEAAADAPVAGNLLTPVAWPVETDKARGVASRFRHGVDWVRIQNDTVYVRSEVGQIAAAVVEEVPFKVQIVEPRVPIVQNGEMSLQIVAERAEGFDEPITVKMLWNPPGVSALPDMVIPKGGTKVAYKFNATPKAETRKWHIGVIASATVKGGTAYVSSQPAELEVAPPFLAGKIEIAKVERGQTAKLVCALEQKIPFAGTAEARLIGLPDGVTAKPVEITQDSKEAVFEIVTTAKSPTGTNKNVSCSVTIIHDGEPIVHTIAPGSVLRVDPPRGKPIAAVPASSAGGSVARKE